MCNTFVAMPAHTADGSVIFGKNSDREPNEAQCLEYYPQRFYKQNETLRCTYLQISQVNETNAILISRPFWLWGAEMGANEKGVVIGNEAVFTKMPYNRTNGFTGMDLLRLALERSSTSANAIENIVQLLSDYGQGGICGFEDMRLTYHNSYIIADSNEAWVLETAGHLWAARKINEYYAISNGLTIGEEFDVSHPELISTAAKKGWLKKGQSFNFAHCYSDWFYTTFSACRNRRRNAVELLQNKVETFDVAAAISLLRDHHDDRYRPDNHFLMNQICAHSANKLSRHSSQTTGSFIAHLDNKRRTFWATGTAAPCTGVFKPVWFHDEVLPNIGPAPNDRFDPDTLWWQHELLHRSILKDFDYRHSSFQIERDSLEAAFLDSAKHASPQTYWNITYDSFQQSKAQTSEWIKLVQQLPIKRNPKLYYRRYWESQNRKAGIRII